VLRSDRWNGDRSDKCCCGRGKRCILHSWLAGWELHQSTGVAEAAIDEGATGAGKVGRGSVLRANIARRASGFWVDGGKQGSR
jgi:hypothetical protein